MNKKKFFFNKVILIANIILAIAAIFSIYISLDTLNEYKKDGILDKRPYLWVESYGFKSGDYVIPDDSTIKISVLNSPAKVIFQNYKLYYTFNDINNFIYDYNRNINIYYPSDLHEYTHTYSYDYLNYVKYNLYRYAKIEYTSLLSSDIYHYEVLWKYNLLDKKWDVIELNAN